MAGFFNDVLKGFLGSDYLKDYKHASNTFRSAGYANAPRLKFLFHVYFNVNTFAIPGLTTLFGARESSQISVLTKSVDLPSYTFDVETLNQYNRKRNIQTKINYDPVTVSFHDDSSDVVRSLWFAYYNYFYKDGSQEYDGNQYTASTNQNAGSGISNFLSGYLPSSVSGALGIGGGNTTSPVARGNNGSQNVRDIYAADRIGSDWGYIGEGADGVTNKPQFFKDITIYGFNQHSFVSYTLVNPIITDFKHDTYDYSAGGDTMSNSMTIKYESVKYGSGAIGSSTVPGFANPEHYDNEPSSLSRPGSNNSFFGQGGILDAGVGVFEDLGQGNILGAATKAGRAIYTLKNMENPGGTLKEEVLGETKRVISQAGQQTSNNNMFFATPEANTAIKATMVNQNNGASIVAPINSSVPQTSQVVTSNGENIGIPTIQNFATPEANITPGLRTEDDTKVNVSITTTRTV